jgi:pimeloyl-ACP methyl ester carboxylesterase
MFKHLHYSFSWLRWSKPKGEPRSIPKGLERHWVDTASGRLEILAAVPDQRADGPPMFFVHGSMGSAWIWSDYMRFFATEYGIPCYAISLRGHGESWHPSFLRLAYGTTRTMMADDLVAGIQWAEKLEGQEVVLVGHSNGGGLSQDILSQGRVGVRGLALLGAVPATGM